MSSLNSLPVLMPKKVEPTEKQPKSDKELERLRKVRERIIRNRASANASRQKKKQYLELLEKKNKELTQHKEIIDKENQKLKNENENLKLQIQYLNQTLNRMNAIINNNYIQNSTPLPNIINNNINSNCISPLTENFTSDINSIINSPESLSNSSPLFNDIHVIPSPINESVMPSSQTFVNNLNVNTNVSNLNVLSPQSSVGEPAALTNENSLQRTLFCQRIMHQVLQTVILTKSLTTFLMMTLASIIQTSAYRPSSNNNNFKNLYQKKNCIQLVPVSTQKPSQTLKQQELNYLKSNYFKYWNNKYSYWKDKMS